jgi:hypothetical protein
MSWWLERSVVCAESERMAASPRQRRAAAEILRAGGTQTEAAAAAGMNVSTIKRWLDQPAFQAIVRGSPDIRVGAAHGWAAGRCGSV